MLFRSVSQSRYSRAAFWGRRVKLLINGNLYWLTIPLQKPEKRGRISVPLMEMMIDQSNQEKLKNQLKTVRQFYCKAPYFTEIFPYFQEYFSEFQKSLAEKNLLLIRRILEGLEIKLQIIKSSELNPSSSSTALLIDLLKAVGADCYICGDGARGYQKDDLFEKNNILLKYNNFCHPTYPQIGTNEFVSGLSIFDTIANVGFKQTILLLKN